MNVTRFDKNQARWGHHNTMMAMDALPPGVVAPFKHAWCWLPAHGAMEGHTHPAEEVYIFFGGQGVVVVGNEERPAMPGDVVEVPPDAFHTVKNPSDDEMTWLTLWWPPLG
jgi:mannose-6-phosphate isomerase-like protein (cupin superfamily)